MGHDTQQHDGNIMANASEVLAVTKAENSATGGSGHTDFSGERIEPLTPWTRLQDPTFGTVSYLD